MRPMEIAAVVLGLVLIVDFVSRYNIPREIPAAEEGSFATSCTCVDVSGSFRGGVMTFGPVSVYAGGTVRIDTPVEEPAVKEFWMNVIEMFPEVCSG